jgi:hypothetical protein
VTEPEPAWLPEHGMRLCARQGGKTQALRAEIERLLREGWTEVTDEPEHAPRVDGVRLFKGPAALTEDASS